MNVADNEQPGSWKSPRNIYWVVLTLVALVAVVARRSQIWPGSLSFLDQGLLVFLAFLLVLPLASEMEVFGIKLRRELNDTKRELSSRLDMLQTTVQTSVGVRSDVNVTVPLISPDQLQRLEQAVRREREPAEPPVPDGPEGQVPAHARFLFTVRYLLEQAVDEAFPGVTDGRSNYRQKVRALMREGYLSSEDVAAFDQVWSIASRAIHGEMIEETYMQFVRDTFPYLITALGQISNAVQDDG